MLSLLLTFKSMEAGILAPAQIYEHLNVYLKSCGSLGVHISYHSPMKRNLELCQSNQEANGLGLFAR